MNNKLKAKTRLFNFVRKIFIYLKIDLTLREVFLTTGNPIFLQKLIPNNYQYPQGTKKLLIKK